MTVLAACQDVGSLLNGSAQGYMSGQIYADIFMVSFVFWEAPLFSPRAPALLRHFHQEFLRVPHSVRPC